MSSISTLKERFAKLRTEMTASVRRIGNCAVVATLAAVALTSLAPGQASAETRSLKVYYVHTGEKAEIAFKKNGRYLPDGLKRLNVFLRDWRRNEPTKMDPRLFDLVWQVYKSTGSKQYITVVSAYRSPATNNMLRSKSSGVAKKSQHTMGRAMDFFIPGVPLAKMRSIAMRYQLGGVGYYPRSGSPFVHLDVGNVRSWPRMSRKQLLALFPDGKTAHLPADGKPLPGYKAALAMIEKRKSSGGDVMMASNSSSAPKRKTLFGALFGGADEEEDNNDSATPARAAPARAAPARQAPAVVPPAPVQQPEALIAALPARDVPRPIAAPRPEAVVEAEPQPEEAPVVAVNIPVPAFRPAVAEEDPVAVAIAGQLADSTVADVTEQAEAEQQLASAQPLLTGYVPVPASRPETESATALLASIVVPSARPELARQPDASDAIADIVNDNAEAPVALAMADTATSSESASDFPLPTAAPRSPAQLALVAPRDEIGELIAPPADDYDLAPVAAAKPAAPVEPAVEQVASLQTASVAPVSSKRAEQVAMVGDKIDTGVRTTAKTARYAAKKPSRPRPVIQPAVLPAPEVVMSSQSVARTVPVTSPHLRNDALRTAPKMVYTTGFQPGDMPRAKVNQFSGNAVTFLAVAKFSETN